MKKGIDSFCTGRNVPINLYTCNLNIHKMFKCSIYPMACRNDSIEEEKTTRWIYNIYSGIIIVILIVIVLVWVCMEW